MTMCAENFLSSSYTRVPLIMSTKKMFDYVTLVSDDDKYFAAHKQSITLGLSTLKFSSAPQSW